MGTQEATKALEAQCADFRKLYDLGLEQRDYIEREDVQGLGGAFARMHRVMDSIRLRENELPSSSDCNDELLEKRERLRLLIMEIQALRQRNQDAVERMRDTTRGELRRLGKGRQAARGYGNRASAGGRFFDGIR